MAPEGRSAISTTQGDSRTRNARSLPPLWFELSVFERTVRQLLRIVFLSKLSPRAGREGLAGANNGTAQNCRRANHPARDSKERLTGRRLHGRRVRSRRIRTRGLVVSRPLLRRTPPSAGTRTHRRHDGLLTGMLHRNLERHGLLLFVHCQRSDEHSKDPADRQKRQLRERMHISFRSGPDGPASCGTGSV